MSILFVLLMFLLVMSINYFYFRTRAEVIAQPQAWAGPQPARMQREYGFSIPEGYCFHPGHTWVLKEGGENARVGVDSFAAQFAHPGLECRRGRFWRRHRRTRDLLGRTA